MRDLDAAQLSRIAGEHRYPLAFATVSGAHLYGFASVDSDVDLRGAHVLPLPELVGLRTGPETVTSSWVESDGAEVDLVTHDLGKFLRLLLRPNGYVLEQLLSPHVVITGPVHAELVAQVPALVTSRHSRHYEGFAHNQWQLHERGGELKPLLYTFRVLLTGIHLMRSGQTVAHLPSLIDLLPETPGYLAELIEAKAAAEHGDFRPADHGLDPDAVAADVAALHECLATAAAGSSLPAEPSAEPALDDLLRRARLA